MKAAAHPSATSRRGAAGEPIPGGRLGGYSQAWESWSRASAGMIESAAEVTREMMSFSQRRLQADADALKALASCHGPGEILEWQQAFAAEAAAQYLDEAGRLASRSFAMMNGALASARGDLS